MYNEYMEDGDIYLDKIKVAKIIYSYDYSKENNQLSLAEIYGV